MSTAKKRSGKDYNFFLGLSNSQIKNLNLNDINNASQKST
jgi:hypothetical protein